MRSLLRTAPLLLFACNCVQRHETSPRDANLTSSTDGHPPPGGDLPAFPGAEGFGAFATGGRGGEVCYVTTLAASGAGSLQDCVSRVTPTYVLFQVSGVIDGPVQLTRPDVTIAGQTSPGGVTIRGGLICDNIYEPGSDCRNLVLRHLRSRQADSDTLRLGGTVDVIVDHCSFAGAQDETIEISRSHRITIQESVIAEPIGAHYHWGGVLLNYSTTAHPLGEITLHHDVWNGVFGRLPEISCEENGDAPGTDCAGHVIELELASNLMFDVSDPIWHNRCVGNNEGNDCPASDANVQLALDWVDNVMMRRSGAGDAPMIEPAVVAAPHSQVYYAGNRLYVGAAGSYADLPVPSRGARLPFPAVTVTPAAEVVAHVRARAGAFPRDAMDTRLAGYLDGPVDDRPAAWVNEQGIDRGDGLTVDPAPPAPPADGDGDGMPDAWETAHGLDPATPGANAASGLCAAGYPDLECYLNELADALVTP